MIIEKLEFEPITLFESLYTQKGNKLGLLTALKRIKKGTSKTLISEIRKGNKELKKKLPCVLFGGYFKDRTNLISPSGLASLDFDKVDSLQKLSSELRKSNYILSFWLSPSGNGIKALVRIPLVKSKEAYKKHYLAILREFKELNPDISTKDMNRLCFESYDPELYLNPNANVFTKKIEIKPFESTKKELCNDLSDGKKVDRILKWWLKNFGFVEGQRNNNLFVLACSLSEFGISENITKNLFSSFESSDFNFSEIEKIIRSAYSKTAFNSKSFAS